jgi:hypothetical protein
MKQMGNELQQARETGNQSIIFDYPNAPASHKQGVELIKQMRNELRQARETGN